ncbi:MAG: DNA topoisomerase IV subunit A [Bacilli bacterium]|nr:DNA topoisomerase IV subunit A [Bacilli bacterium]MDD4408019.1 DNA topoisomerase IV subunit A [Bacilli bacterium]
MKEVLKKIHDYSLEEIMGERFARYSKYIIQDRAIPDVRDGLKPVQRRIIYAMYRDKNTYDKIFKKCANAVGNVLGKYHPHGDTSVYDALVRMSQNWKQNHILIEVDGNNGSIDGDSAAAYRYTETRLAKISEELLKDIDKDTVIMAPNYSDTLFEPTVLPAKFPNLLVNGASGISAGYATNIPPHNLNEVIDAVIKRIDSPNCYLDTILDIIKGPDFPMGGIIQGVDGIKSAFDKGRGKVVVRSRYEYIKSKGKSQIIITEIPFEVNKAFLVKKIDDIRLDKKLDGIAEVRDESDKDSSIRIAIDLKSGADQELIINYLLKNTDLQTSYNYNMVTIVNRRPKLLGILPILDAYIKHQKEIIYKRSEFDLAFAKKELHITDGLIKAISILDEVIALIRGSKNKADAIQNLINKFDFTEEQATAIVMLQLYRLTNTDVTVLEEKLTNLRKIITHLELILSSSEKLNLVIKEELRKIKKEYGTPRKTEICLDSHEIVINEKDLITKEDVIIILTNDGYLKRVSKKSYSSNAEETALKPGDYVISYLQTNTLNKLIIFTKLGNYIYLPIHEIPICKWKELGVHISNLVLVNPDDRVVNAYVINESIDNPIVELFTKNGMVKRTNLNDFIVSRYSKTYTAIKLKPNDFLINVLISKENTLLITKSGYYLNYKTEEIPISGSKAAGVKGINLKEDQVIAGLNYNDLDEYVNIFTNKSTGKRVKLNDLKLLTRAKRGNTIIKKIKSNNYEILNSFITSSKDVIGLKLDEDINYIKNSEISIMDLISTGSTISKKKIDKYFIKKDLYILKEENNIKENESSFEEDIKEFTLEDFIEDFKL